MATKLTSEAAVASGSSSPAKHAHTEADEMVLGFGPSGVLEDSVLDVPWSWSSDYTGTSTKGLRVQ